MSKKQAKSKFFFSFHHFEPIFKKFYLIKFDVCKQNFDKIHPFYVVTFWSVAQT